MVIPLPFLNQYPNLKKKNPRIHKGDEEDYLVYIEYTGGKKIVAMFINLIRKYWVGVLLYQSMCRLHLFPSKVHMRSQKKNVKLSSI